MWLLTSSIGKECVKGRPLEEKDECIPVVQKRGVQTERLACLQDVRDVLQSESHYLRTNGKTPRAALEISEERRPLRIETAKWLGAMEVRRCPANFWDVKWGAASFEAWLTRRRGSKPDIPLAKKVGQILVARHGCRERGMMDLLR